MYECLFDGALINEVLLQIDPEPLQAVSSPLTPTNGGANSILVRIKTFECIVKTIKSFYEVGLFFCFIIVKNEKEFIYN